MTGDATRARVSPVTATTAAVLYMVPAVVAKSLVRFVALKSNRIETVDLLHIEGDLRSQFDVRFTCKLQVYLGRRIVVPGVSVLEMPK